MIAKWFVPADKTLNSNLDEMEMLLLSGIGPSETNPEFNEIYFDLSFNPDIAGSQNQFDEDNEDNYLGDLNGDNTPMNAGMNNFGQVNRTFFDVDSPDFYNPNQNKT